LEYGLSVSEVMAVPALRQARILAGAAGVDRMVQRVNVMEVPDILPWVKPHELLLTTGYPLRDQADTLPELIAALDQIGLAALAIKPLRYLDEIPPRMLAEAERLGFPVIELPSHVSFDDVINQALVGVLNRQAAALARAEEVHRALVSVVLAGGGLTELTREMAHVVDAAVMVTTPDGRVLAQAGEEKELAVVSADRACFDPTGRFRTDVEPFGVRAHGAGWHAVVPIVADRVDHGRVVAFSTRRKLDSSDVHALERAATVAALAIVKQLAVAAVEGKYRSDYLRDLLAGRMEGTDTAVIVAHCSSLGWDIERPLAVVVAELDPSPTSPSTSSVRLRPVLERFTAAWQTVVSQVDPTAPVVGFNSEVVVLLGMPEHGDLDRRVRELVRRVAGDGGGGRRSFSTGVSRVVQRVEQLPEAYEQARKAARVGRRVQGSGALAYFDSLGVHRLLSQIPDVGEVRRFVNETLRDLAHTSDPEMADLRRTLAVLLETNLNVAETARRLHFHYNTLRYRISKLERILGPFTRDGELRLNLAVALRAMEMHDV